MLSKFKDPISGLTHLAGALLALAGTLMLIVPAFRNGETVKAVSFLIFGLSLILLYSASATYHLLRLDEKGNLILRRIDHMMIYLLIAGTYTPICLVALRGAWGWGLLSVIGGLAVAGVILTLFVINTPRWVSRIHLHHHGLDGTGSFCAADQSPPGWRGDWNCVGWGILHGWSGDLCPQEAGPVPRCFWVPRDLAFVCHGRQFMPLWGHVLYHSKSLKQISHRKEILFLRLKRSRDKSFAIADDRQQQGQLHHREKDGGELVKVRMPADWPQSARSAAPDNQS